jgi:hypothetical protein
LSDNVVKLTEANSEAEAATICGYLESLGIHATYDKGGTFPGMGTGADPVGIGGAHAGRQEILVRTEDLEAAREALAQANEPELPK